MKVLKMRVILGVMLLVGGLALIGPPFVPAAAAQAELSNGQILVAMSIFMGEEPKPAAPLPKPTPGQPGAKPAGPAATTGPATGVPTQTGAGTTVPAAGAPKSVGAQPAMTPTAPAMPVPPTQA